MMLPVGPGPVKIDWVNKYPAPDRPFGRPGGHAGMRPRRGLLKLLRNVCFCVTVAPAVQQNRLSRVVTGTVVTVSDGLSTSS